MITVGRTFRNCLKDPNKIAEVLLGYAYHYVVEDRAVGDAAPTRYVVELTPLSNGGWVISTIEGVEDRRLSTEAKAVVLRCIRELGALAPTNPARHPEAKALESTLGIYRFDPFDFHDLEVADAAA